MNYVIFKNEFSSLTKPVFYTECPPKVRKEKQVLNVVKVSSY